MLFFFIARILSIIVENEQLPEFKPIPSADSNEIFTKSIYRVYKLIHAYSNETSFSKSHIEFHECNFDSFSLTGNHPGAPGSFGGVLSFFYSQALFKECLFTKNNAFVGAAIYFHHSDYYGWKNMYYKNYAYREGGAITMKSDNENFFYSYYEIYDQCSAEIVNGALEIDGVNEILIDSSHFYENSAGISGGALGVFSSNCMIFNCLFAYNTCGNSTSPSAGHFKSFRQSDVDKGGGAIHVFEEENTKSYIMSTDHCCFIGNQCLKTNEPGDENTPYHHGFDILLNGKIEYQSHSDQFGNYEYLSIYSKNANIVTYYTKFWNQNSQSDFFAESCAITEKYNNVTAIHQLPQTNEFEPPVLNVEQGDTESIDNEDFPVNTAPATKLPERTTRSQIPNPTDYLDHVENLTIPYRSMAPPATKTGEFTLSQDFSYSYVFTESQDFTISSEFSNSNMFSVSFAFTLSEIFSLSRHFTESEVFSKSTEFSLSDYFIPTNQFSYSNEFTSSNDFSLSGVFSMTDCFSKSGDFSMSGEFSISDQFLPTDIFSFSLVFNTTEQFSHSEEFSMTGEFSHTNDFSQSGNFTVSQEFTPSKIVTPTSSKTFLPTALFTQSNTFTPHPTRSYLDSHLTYSQVLSNSYSNSRSLSQSFVGITHSQTLVIEISFTETQIENIDKTNIEIEVSSYTHVTISSYVDFVIYIPIVTNVYSLMIFNKQDLLGNGKNTKLSDGVVIGLSCGSVIIVFVVAGIGVFVYRQSHGKIYSTNLSDSDIFTQSSNNEEEIVNQKVLQAEEDLEDNWL
ncbi:hypothetical protein TRFO_37627 [Tritrichomonas foetus]|uniref:Polymorphic outer membrane protein n=1 Tax=Tritrichomonas foetus TaxID=1144522 RepID=A0A1J4JC53_9EUKA|nr:hypothetical protein TRFO_37627 [Tritrichomonas foetus]|eukprot:OHS96241.1 hypothetical protein TRFO_37627 [Tritrichomonas foetus]